MIMLGGARDAGAGASTDAYMANNPACWHTKPDFVSLLTLKFNDSDDSKDECGAGD